MGIFLVGIVGFALFLVIIGAILFVFIPCLIIAIINLVQGARHHWPKRNVIPLIITGTIASLFILLFLMGAVLSATGGSSSSAASSSRSAAQIMQTILPLL